MSQVPSFASASSFSTDCSQSILGIDSLLELCDKLPPTFIEVNNECRTPKQIALILEGGMVKKGKELDFITTLILAFHAGMFVGFGGAFYTVSQTGTTHYGLQKFAGGAAFSVGLAMIILSGAELFTGNCMLIIAYLSKKICFLHIVRNLTIVYFGNFCGALAVAAMQVWGRTHENSTFALGKEVLDIGQAKCVREWGQCYCLGMLCNIIVCWAIWMSIAGRNAMDKIIVFILPICAFAALGFEHSVANMYFVSTALMVKHYGSQNMWDTLATTVTSTVPRYTTVLVNDTTTNFMAVPVTRLYNASVTYSQYLSWPDLTLPNFIVKNLIPCTIGNIFGAWSMVGIVYWYLYLRDENHVSRLQIGNFLASPPSNKAISLRRRKFKKAVQMPNDNVVPSRDCVPAYPPVDIIAEAYNEPHPTPAASPDTIIRV